MKAAAVVCTYGREALCELLACVERQTLELPTLVYVDRAPELRLFDLPECVQVVRGLGCDHFGGVRRASVECARAVFALEPDSGVLVLDDDDFYSSRHFELTVLELERAAGGWVGGLAMGLSVENGTPEYVRGESGVGQHGTWGFKLARYDQAGGYPAELERDEDLALGYAMGWKTCTPHWHCTHVRRHHAANISGAADFDRDMVRRLDKLATEARPRWSTKCESFEAWCAAR